MKNKLAYLLVFFLLISLVFFLVPSSKEPKEPLKVNPELNIRKRVAQVIKNKPKIKKHRKSNVKIQDRIKKADFSERKIASSLLAEINKYTKLGIKDIRIALNTTDNTDALLKRIKNYGGEVLRKRQNFMGIEVPVNKAEQLIKESRAVQFARLPFKFYPAGEISEGVNLKGANIFHDSLHKGEGVKIAVVDVGFKGMTEAISNGDLPADVITHDFSGNGLETEYFHGTACAEIVYDMAPEAELHLLKLGDEFGGYDVIDYCISNSIDIVSMSVGTFGSGPGDGTGYVDEAFGQLRAAGILLVVSAGNYGNTTYEIEGIDITLGVHWEGTFTDHNGDTCHEFKSYDTDSYYNVIGAVPNWNDDEESSTSEVSILVRWDDDWGGSDIDYNIYLYEYDYNPENPSIGALVAFSNFEQAGYAGQEPWEYISMDIPDIATEGRFYALEIERVDTDTPVGTKLEIYLGGTSQFSPFPHVNGSAYTQPLATSQGSVAEPADSESVLTVGAVDYTNWTTGPQEDYSSQGPTNDWNSSAARIKPDIIAPDAVTTYTYGPSSFTGTSAATPHIAGMAALILSMNPDMTPDELQDFLEAKTTDMGASGKDNLYGWGRLSISDTDSDGMPDYWETDYGLSIDTDDAAGDIDGDSLTNINEFKNGTSPSDTDTDSDGMPDGWEVQYGLYPLVDDAEGDLDEDGFSNIKEYQEETLPNDASSKPSRGMPWLQLLLGDD